MEKLSELLVLILEVIARIVTPSLKHRLAKIATDLLPDVPLIEGYWRVRFEDSKIKHGKLIGNKETFIDAQLMQFGRKISGRGYLYGKSNDPFKFSGRIRRDIFLGQYQRKNARILGGVGTFVLKIDGHSESMTGQCLWYEGRIDQVVNSTYHWIKKV